MNEQEIIKYIVEKSSKGVKKQIKGYVKSIKDEIDVNIRIMQSIKKEHEDLINRTAHLRADWIALDLMIKESTAQKELLIQIKDAYNQAKNTLTDLKLLSIEIDNILKYKLPILGIDRENLK